MDAAGMIEGYSPALLIALFSLGSAMGVLAAFFGVGGGVVIGPALLIAGLSGVTAIGTSTVFLCATSLLAVCRHRLPAEDLRLGLLLGVLLPLGIEPGRRLLLALESHGYDKHLLLIGFLPLIAWTIRAQLRPPSPPPPDARPPRAPILLGTGLLAGVLAGLFGIGGGIVLVPVLTSRFHRPPRRAVPISLLAISVGGLYAAVAYAASGRVAWEPAGVLIAGSVLGVPAGARALDRLAGSVFRPLFALLLLITAGAMLLHAAGATALAPVVLIGAAILLAAVILFRAARARTVREPT